MSFPPDTSKLDERQIMQSVFDEDNRRLRVDAEAHINNVSIAVDLDPTEDGVFVADKDSGNKLKVNADGSVNVAIATGLIAVNKIIYNEISAVASGSMTNLVDYTVPAGKTAIIDRLLVSGQNIAKYEVYVNGIKIDSARTYFGASLNIEFNYDSKNSNYVLQATDILNITVRHDRPSASDFEGRIQITEVG